MWNQWFLDVKHLDEFPPRFEIYLKDCLMLCTFVFLAFDEIVWISGYYIYWITGLVIVES